MLTMDGRDLVPITEEERAWLLGALRSLQRSLEDRPPVVTDCRLVPHSWCATHAAPWRSGSRCSKAEVGSHGR